MSVVAATGLSSGCQSAASTRKPSIALMARKRGVAPEEALNASGKFAGRSMKSYSMLAALSAYAHVAAKRPMTANETTTTGLRILHLPLRPEFILPTQAHADTVNFLSADDDPVDLSHVGHAVEHVGVEHDEVGALARRHHAELIVEPQGLGGFAGRRQHHFHRGETVRRHVFELEHRMHPEPAVLIAGRVAAQNFAHARGVELAGIDGVEDAS